MMNEENNMATNNDTTNENGFAENEIRSSDSTSENEERTLLTNDEIRNLMSHGGFNNGINPEALNKLMNQPSPDTKALLDRVSNIIEIQDGNIQRAYTKIGNLENQITALKVVSKFNSIIAIASIIVAIVAIILG
jgi:hypothetical protein|nr:MAG TPA: hypothetical protein [Caudoviricetes sp.]